MDDDQMDASGSGHNAQRKRAHSSGENPENRDAFEPPASRRRQGLDSNSSFFAQQAQVMAQVSSMLNQLQQDSVTMKRRQDVVYQRQVDSQRRQEELQQQQTADIQSLAQAVADLGRRVADFENPQNCPANNNAALVQLQHTSSNPAHAFGVNVGASTSSASTTSSGSSIGSSVNADTHSDASATSAEPPVERHGSRAPEPHDHPTNPLAQKVFDLPAFSGKPGEWRVFITAYRQSSAAFGYTDLQNLYRLQKSLSGDARIAVEGLLLSPETTETVISNLELNFGRPQLLVSEQTKRIREHLHVRENNYEQLIEYATCVTNVVAYLDTNETRYALHEQSMLAEMLDKLPSTRRYDWLEYAESISTMPTAIEFSVWLKKIAVRVSKMPVLPSTQSRPPNGGRQRDERRCMLNVDESCRLCDGQHGTHECDAFKRQTVVQRWRTVREYNMCFGCLQEGHGNAQCDSSRGRALHHMLRDAEPENGVNPRTQPPQQRSRQESNQRQQQSVTAADTLSSNSTAASTSSQKRPNPFDTQPAENTIGLCLDGPEQPLFFRVVPVTLHGPDRSVDTFALLDEGSSVTLIDTKMADQLKLDGPARQLNLKWIGNQSSSVQSKSLELMISGVAPHCKRHKLCDVRTVDHLRLPTQTVILSPDDTRYDHLRDLPISTYRNAVPTILIGLDHCHLGAASKTRTGKNGGLVAAKTALGWIVYGRRCGNSPEYLLHCCEQEAATIEMMLNDFQSTEGFGVMAPKEDMESDDDMRARALLQKTTVRVGGRFQTGLLWRTEDVQLPDSFAMALRRYNTVARKIKQDAEYGMLYTKQMADLVTKKYARKLSTAEASIRDDRTWFLPHFGVQSVHKPGKLRIVFDAAAMVHNTSLNSALLKGPDLNASLLKILMQFRLRPFGVCADISEMFLQISMRPEDRRAQRFLWREDGGSPPDVYEMMVMTFGAACSPTSAQYAKNANAA